MRRRWRRNPDAYTIGTVAEYGRKRPRTARIDARMLATRTGRLTGYLGEDEGSLVMLRPREITRARAADVDTGLPAWVKVLVVAGVAVGAVVLLGRR